MATTVPMLPNGAGVYEPVERLLLDLHNKEVEWSLEDLARLARLAADIRSDIGFLEGLVKGVEEHLADAVDQDRSRDLTAVA